MSAHNSVPDEQTCSAVDESALKKVWVIIPALNEESAIGRVLSDLPRVGRTIVVDNGSTDNTARVANAHGADVVCESLRGYGAACLAGLARVQQMTQDSPPPEVIVFIDGDYSDYPDRLPKLVAPILSGQYDLVIGSRMTGERERGAMPIQSRFGNWLACTLMRFLFAAKFTDLGPFRAIRYSSLLGLKMSDKNFGWTIEMQIKACRHRLRYCEIPVPYRQRIGRSKISGTISGSLRAGLKILGTIARYAFVKRDSNGQSTERYADG